MHTGAERREVILYLLFFFFFYNKSMCVKQCAIHVAICRSELETKLEVTVTELEELRKIVDNLHQSDEILSNSSDRRRSVMENCRLLIKEVIAGDVTDTYL